MTRTRLATVLSALVVALLALALPGVASATDKLDAQQWNIGTFQIKDGKLFQMRNDINHSLMGYGHRTLGVDLDWGSNRGDWMLVRKPVGNVRDHRVVLTSSDQLALYNTKARKYLVHGDENFGIDLDWSRYPSYEWKININRSGDTSLYNTDQGDYVVYGKRPFGINLMFLKDLRKQQPPAVGSLHDASVGLAAQQVVSGYIPFLGTFGGGVNGTLTRVQNPWSGVALSFVKPGHSTTECGNSSSVVTLGPNQMMTPDQMKAAFGSEKPKLPATFLACAASNQSLSLVFINITYRIDG
jgi:hypothetical protein